MSAVVPKDGNLSTNVITKTIRDKFLAHGMSMTKTMGLVIGHLLCDGKISSLDDIWASILMGLLVPSTKM